MARKRRYLNKWERVLQQERRWLISLEEPEWERYRLFLAERKTKPVQEADPEAERRSIAAMWTVPASYVRLESRNIKEGKPA